MNRHHLIRIFYWVAILVAAMWISRVNENKPVVLVALLLVGVIFSAIDFLYVRKGDINKKEKNVSLWKVLVDFFTSF